MHTYITNITLNYIYIPHIEAAYTNCLTNSLNIYVGKTLVPNFGAPFTHPFVGGKLYYSGGLSLNRSIDLTSIGL